LGSAGPVDRPSAATGHDHGGTDDSESADAAPLIPLSGSAFDQGFLKIMIAHHVAAQSIAQTTIANGSNPETRQMAHDLLSTQAAEISQMRGMVGSS